MNYILHQLKWTHEYFGTELLLILTEMMPLLLPDT